MNFDVLFRIVMCCLLYPWETYGFNLDIENAIVFDGPPESGYFGYSVALHSWQSKYWVIVGAPLSNVTSASGSETLIRYGAAYRCEYTGNQQCSVINIDNRPVWRKQVTFNDVPNTWVNMEEKTGMWLGGVVYSTGKDGKALACAPRYIFRGAPVTGNAGGDVHYSWLLGRCNLLNQDLSGVSHNGVVDPCSTERKGNNYYGYCTAGLSAEYSVDGYDVIMGVVGAKRGKGGLMLYSDRGKTVKSGLSELAIGDYMGYSVTSGHFTQRKRIEYIGGAPRADGVKGKVVIYHIYENYLSVKSTLPRPKNIPTGTYFGGVICAVDLDNNQFTDVLVGAPYFTHVKDEGRVYIYLNNGQGALNLQDNFLEGDRKVNAHFGQSIAAVGDLNADGFQDIAIGAPFERDGSGAVYLYHGSSKGIELHYRQKILGLTIKTGIKLFGYSLSGGVDVDENGYPDIAVGAYGSDHAVMLRSQSIVNVVGEIRLSEQQITLEGNHSVCNLESTQHKCVNITIVFYYNDASAATTSKDLHIWHTVELDKDRGQNALRRLFFWDALNRKRTFILEDNYTIRTRNTYYSLQPLTVYLMEKDELGDVNSPLTFDLNISLPAPPCDGLCPVLNDYLPSTYRAEVFFKKKCKNHAACAPDLALSGNLVFSPRHVKELRIGVVKNFTLQIIVENKAEDSAYATKLILKYPDKLDYVGSEQDVDCDKTIPVNGTATINCDVGNPMQGKTNKSFIIKFSPGSVREAFILEVEALSQDEDVNDYDNKIRFPVTVKFEADVEITGSSKQDQVVYSGPVTEKEDVKKDLDSIGPKVIQTFTLRNKGPSAVDSSLVTVNFPYLYSLSKPESYLFYLIQIELNGASGSCNANINPLDIKVRSLTASVKPFLWDRYPKGCKQASCKAFQCSLGTLKMGDKAEITMTFRLWKNTLLKELDPLKAVDLETTAKVKVPDEITQADENNDMATILTTAKPAQTGARKRKMPWWIIFSSALSGCVLLGAVIFLLYKVRLETIHRC
ncbi:unnamed protein product [Porites evermanni]|uniref:Integrin alpha-2 domain-containing protein n=1 Tax=Porites evermanni TaxID=104178 RepID=A0ABN8LJI8_9CNID|nr:unnamed protein product [Porites evermanni]